MDWIVPAGLALLALFAAYAFRRISRRSVPPAEKPTAPIEATQSEPAVSATQTRTAHGPEADPAELMNRLFTFALGREAEIEGRSTEHAEIEQATVEALAELANQPRHLPRRPQLLPQLMTAVNDDATSMREIARLIARDPALTGNLLRIANSPAYRMQPAPIESIERAVAVLGTHGIRSTIAAAVLQPVLSSGGAFAPLPDVIWELSLRAASSAESHAMLIGNDDPFAAQLLALLHGLGSIAIFRIARDEFADHPEAAPSAALFSHLIESYAAPTAAVIASSWELSPRIVAALNEQGGAAHAGSGRPGSRGALGDALHFGRVTAALSLLVDAGRIAPEEARTLLPGVHEHALQVDRIWDRLMRASRAARDASTLAKS